MFYLAYTELKWLREGEKLNLKLRQDANKDVDAGLLISKLIYALLSWSCFIVLYRRIGITGNKFLQPLAHLLNWLVSLDDWVGNNKNGAVRMLIVVGVAMHV